MSASQKLGALAAKRIFAGGTAGAVCLAVIHNLEPAMLEVSTGVIEATFGVCLLGLVESHAVRRTSECVYLSLYLLFGLNEAAALWLHRPLETCADGLAAYLGVGVLVLAISRTQTAMGRYATGRGSVAM